MPDHKMPYENLIAYQVAVELLASVRDAAIKDSRLRDQALRAAKSVCLNIAEGVGRSGVDDRKRVFAIARGEVCEVSCALEIAVVAGDCVEEPARKGCLNAGRVYALLTALIFR